MKKNLTFRTLSLVTILLFTIAGHSQQYQVTELGTFGGEMSFARDINDAGQVVGEAQDSIGYNIAFLWENGIMIELGSLAGYHSSATAINNSGQVVGISDDENLKARPFLWENDIMTNLGTIAEAEHCYAFGINNSGQVIGYADSGQVVRAFIWQNGNMVDIGTLGGRQVSYALGINDAGQIVGNSFNPDDYWRPFLWQNGMMTDIGTLGGNFGSANDINNAAQVVGSARDVNNNTIAFLWENGNMINLGILGIESSANGINDSGWVVGTSQNKAFIWKDGIMIDLNQLIDSDSEWNLMIAYKINNLGQIVGAGIYNGEIRGFLLTPEASTGIDPEYFTAAGYYLTQNYPNPFNPTTTIRYSILQDGFVSLKVYDLLGREVAILVNEEKQPGVYTVEFDGSNLTDGKAGLSSGVYFYELTAGSFRDVKKLTLIK